MSENNNLLRENLVYDESKIKDINVPEEHHGKCVGLFYFDEKNNDFIGVKKFKIEDYKKYVTNIVFTKNDHFITYDIDHKIVYAENNYFGTNNPDYTSIYRGRIYYNYLCNYFYLRVGDWFDTYKDTLYMLIEKYFNLKPHSYAVSKHSHWNLNSHHKI